MEFKLKPLSQEKKPELINNQQTKNGEICNKSFSRKGRGSKTIRQLFPGPKMPIHTTSKSAADYLISELLFFFVAAWLSPADIFCMLYTCKQTFLFLSQKKYKIFVIEKCFYDNSWFCSSLKCKSGNRIFTSAITLLLDVEVREHLSNYETLPIACDENILYHYINNLIKNNLEIVKFLSSRMLSRHISILEFKKVIATVCKGIPVHINKIFHKILPESYLSKFEQDIYITEPAIMSVILLCPSSNKIMGLLVVNVGTSMLTSKSLSTLCTGVSLQEYKLVAKIMSVNIFFIACLNLCSLRLPLTGY